jgi:FkbM family methyltransferase
MLAHPVADPTFAESRMHGIVPQRELYREVVKWRKHSRTAVDVGAHIGLWASMLACTFDNVIAFEPNAENFDCLAQNTADYVNILVEQKALGAAHDSASLKLPSAGNSGMWHLTPGEDVEVIPLDSLQRDDVDLIKIDVEGFEGHVLLGARQTLLASGPVVIFEDNGVGPKYFGDTWIDPKPILRDLGYKLRLRWRKDEVWLKS